ncbi:hypothetical protein DRO29_07190 [Candidatus Bathyarchaeota archaeon]|nr:MAG: hypothetical protein DRO29_07190 [Candidatus Bathyarchaeota archaeon]
MVYKKIITKVRRWFERMGLSDRRVIFKTGRYSRAITLPSKLKVGREASLAADRLILIDPRGEIPEEELLEFLETHIEPYLWTWLKRRQSNDE